ncbi:hypothetical protein [Viridibacillus arvi]|uniref:hypothetical protein n=1 Tax=Viridibacillus arvi TaxID=263475 RepID=UPI0034CEAD3D
MSQIRLFRKWHGGKWSRIALIEEPYIQVWIKDDPNSFISNKVKVLEVEIYKTN